MPLNVVIGLAMTNKKIDVKMFQPRIELGTFAV